MNERGPWLKPAQKPRWRPFRAAGALSVRDRNGRERAALGLDLPFPVRDSR
jgi:hypothetical protein